MVAYIEVGTYYKDGVERLKTGKFKITAATFYIPDAA